MEITRRTTGDWTDLVVEGRLDGYWAEHLDAGIAEAIREGGLRLRLDLEKVTFLSSAGIGVLVKFHKRLAAVKGSLVIARLSAPVKTVLEMTRLTALLVATGEGGGEATLTVGSTLSRHGLLCEVFDLNPSARMALTSIGERIRWVPPKTGRPGSRRCRAVRQPPPSGLARSGWPMRKARTGWASCWRCLAPQRTCPPTAPRYPTFS